MIQGIIGRHRKFAGLCFILSTFAVMPQVLAEPGDSASSPGIESSNTTNSDLSDKPSSRSDSSTGSLKGHLTTTIDAPEKIIEDLLSAAISRDESIKSLDGKSKHYQKSSSHMTQKSKDMLNFMTAYKGFERSSEAADIILDEQLKPKSKAAVAYIRQRKSDQYQTAIYTALTEMAAGLGNGDVQRRDAIVSSAMERIKSLVGQEAADVALARMKGWSEGLPSENFDLKKAYDVLESESVVKTAVNGALTKDEVVGEIRERLHKYNSRSKTMRVTAKVVNTTLSVAMLTPNFVSPACQVAYLAFCAATGGPEDAKLLNELYLDQRFQSRWKVYNHAATLAANNYSIAVLSKNPVLMQFSKRTLDRMIALSPETVLPQAAISSSGSLDVAKTIEKASLDQREAKGESSNAEGKIKDEKSARLKSTERATKRSAERKAMKMAAAKAKKVRRVVDAKLDSYSM